MKNIAIIGSGISGLTCAYLLSKKHQVSVFEKAAVIGGHTATVDISLAGRDYAIDTGFIVFNNKTYPNFLALLDEIGVDKQETEMSFSVKNPESGLEYNGHNLDTLFAQRRNLVRPVFWQLIREILRFNKLCKAHYLAQNFNQKDTLGLFLKAYGFSRFFTEHYILPMGAAIWSSSLEKMEEFPLLFFVRFFYHHGLLNISDRPQWYVIPRGSRSYLAPLCRPFADNIYVNAEISGITRQHGRVQLNFADGCRQEFDDVVLACHSDQARALLSDASDAEKSVLGAIAYNANQVVLHTDISLLPKRKKAWASWNYQLTGDASQPACVTYNMNILQGITSEQTFCVTLNQSQLIDKSKILKEFIYHHPVFTLAALKAQQQRLSICGKGQSHFAGAYWCNGFHEDGVRSALDVAARFGCFLNGQQA
ncbi:NAD(P)/FAD-dependent oxidoreductase [Thalassomonas actiniarum]|uniref:FAD-dependent oxidoreductase n=1 Tax=Thalassomonas actiniarum TaxID=485447 RepID=A0AAE9YV93_9GAMM|nr:FAD-dependent oxidoreductase [Thalassomonas actiniarum]WDE00272.1 FAD-dependent oxidoreductase [Thalassomonas actiniarum]